MGLKERREREKEERRALILNAARTLLFEKGINATSVSQIARIAEIGVGTIYFYYKSKEEIFADLQAEGLELLYARIRRHCGKEVSPAEKLRLTAETYVRFSETSRDYFDIINYFLSSPDILLTRNLKQDVDQHGRRIITLIVEMIEEGISRGEFKAADPQKHAIMFWGTLHGLLQLKKLQETVLGDISHKDLFQYAVIQLIDGLRI